MADEKEVLEQDVFEQDFEVVVVVKVSGTDKTKFQQAAEAAEAYIASTIDPKTLNSNDCDISMKTRV